MATKYQDTGPLTRSYQNNENGTFVLASEQEMERTIQENKAMREMQTGKETYRLAARVPVGEVERAMREGWFHDDDAWTRWMNDPDNRDHRVYEGRL